MKNSTVKPVDVRTRHQPIGRREVLGLLGGTGALLVVGCGDAGGSSEGTSAASSGEATTGTSSGESSGSSSSGSSSSGETPTTGGDMTGSSTSTGDESSSGDESSTGAVECGEPAAAWATGGTAAMTAQACYPDPFSGGVLSCALICETTAGPCIADTVDRQDVSEGFGGLPVRLALLVVDADNCEPVAGARVEIWHTQRTGVYSGITPSPMQCFRDDPDAANYQYFRGIRTAGDNGRVDFDTCFPGWYPGRAIHIHFRVYRGEDVFATSQLFFADDLNSEIFAEHPDYKEFGPPNTTNITDGIFGKQADKSKYLLDTARMPDGVMLASKVIAVRGSLRDPKCAV